MRHRTSSNRPAVRLRRRRTAVTLLALSGIVVMVACAPSEPRQPAAPPPSSASASAPAPSSTSETAQEETLEDTMPTGFFSLAAGDDAVFRDGEVTGLELQDVLIEGDDGSQRVILSFTCPEVADPLERIELWAAPVEHAEQEGSGEIIAVDGQFILLFSIPGASPQLEGPEFNVTVPREGVVRDVALTGAFVGFEGGGGMYLGLASTETEYRVTSSIDPCQVVIDIRYTSS